MAKISKTKWIPIVSVVVILGGLAVWRAVRPGGEIANASPTRIDQSATEDDVLTMSEVLDMAVEVRASMDQHLDDYTARFVKQEVDTSGILGGETEIEMKVQTRLRGDSDASPMRVYLKFLSPDSVKGREVIWAEDLYDGKMAVHEVGMLLGLKTLWLDPTGMLAMQGQRFPISEIGIVKLVEKLIERGEKDRDNPDISVSLTEGFVYDDQPMQLIRVERSKPGEGEDNFSLAEIVYDPQRKMILSYRSFGWPEQTAEQAPLLESYSYHDVQTNVGLTDKDFDYKNEAYNFPSF